MNQNQENINIPLYDQRNPGGEEEGGNIFGDFKKQLYLDQTAHPMACFCAFFFKALACFLYIVFSWFVGDYIYAFISAVVLQSIDFWITKNVTGRLLVGLRWWSVIQNDGSEKWMFESRNTENKANKVDYYFFWGSLVINFIFWTVFGVLNIIAFNFMWVTINAICMILLGTNVLCFYKCSKDHQQKMKNLKSNLGQELAKKGVASLISNALGAGAK